MYESANELVPMIVFANSRLQQYFLCQHVHATRIGHCLYDKSVYGITKAINTLEKQGFIKSEMAPIQQAIQWQSEDPEDYTYWIDYAFEVGTSHLKARQYTQMRLPQLLDIDVHFVLYVMLSLVVLLVIWMGMKVNKFINSL